MSKVINNYNVFYITGFIGSGKTTIGRKLASDFGFDFIEGDSFVKKHYMETEFVSLYKKWFGSESIIDGELNKKHISSILFSENFSMREYNVEVSDAFESVLERLGYIRNNTLIESANLMMCDFVNTLEYLFVVTAPLDVRIDRIIKRNPELTKDEIMERIKKQEDSAIEITVPIITYHNK